MMNNISEKCFKKSVGRNPENDDLDRCNCKDAGKVGHFMCGWDEKANLPVFMTGAKIVRDDDDDEI